MYIESLKTYQFRNLSDQTVRLAPGVNYFWGNNGQGKTNLLEAVFLLAHVRSFRTSKLRELIDWKKKEASSFAELRLDGGQLVEVGVAIEGKRRRVFYQSQEVKKVSDYLAKVLVVSFSPYDLAVLRGVPAERRRFFNRYISLFEPQYFELSVKAERILRHKRALYQTSGDHSKEIQPWNQLLSEVSEELARRKQRFLQAFQIRLSAAQKEFSVLDGPLSLKLQSDCFHGEGEVKSKQEIQKELSQIQKKEQLMKKVLWGPQRDEYIFELGSARVRQFASQGQTRTVLLLILISLLDLLESSYGEKAIVLLDDVESELDHSRVRWFFEHLEHSGRQVLISGTDPQPILDILSSARIFPLQAGVVAHTT